MTWFVRLHDEDATDADRAAHAGWLAADPRHGVAWAEVAQLWTALQGAAAPNVVVLPKARAVPPQPARPVQRRRFAMAAAVALMVGSAGWMATHPGLFADERTGTGERRSLTLSDGSRVELATASALSVDFTDRERKVVLHDGEAFFSVAKDARPFRVQAADGVITDIGTAFDVKMAAETVHVSVTEGIVDIASGTGQPVRLMRGQSASYSPTGIGPRQTVDPANVGLWREGRLAFDNAPLPDVLRDLERYRHGRIVVMDKSLSRLTVSGMFDATRTDAALSTIERTLPVRLVRITRYLVLVYPAE
ncbi:FecR family protein [Sphingobium cloacae]|uniref:FecR family protein n=1 Tax=Sphingobium cloacae TaxID=120107 RepID=UPI001470A065|nr:FecR family protein [Sphingobium cloacae]